MASKEVKSFDPYACIYDEDEVPDPTAPIFDNVESFISHLQNTKVNSAGTRKKCKEKQTENSNGRQFTEDQMPIQGPRRPGKNLLAFMNKVRRF